MIPSVHMVNNNNAYLRFEVLLRRLLRISFFTAAAVAVSPALLTAVAGGDCLLTSGIDLNKF